MKDRLTPTDGEMKVLIVINDFIFKERSNSFIKSINFESKIHIVVNKVLEFDKILK